MSFWLTIQQNIREPAIIIIENFSRIGSYSDLMKKYFLTGLAIFLPLAITIAIVIFIVNFLTKPFMGLVAKILSHTTIPNVDFLFLSHEQVIRYGSQVAILIALFFFTILCGFFGKWFIFRSLIHLSNLVLAKIPVVNKVYKTTQDIISTIFSSKKGAFKKVVMVPFPYKEAYSLGLVARESPKTCQDTLKEELITVFIPTTPNPTTGILMIFPIKDVVFLDMKVDEAAKYIISCGVVVPKKKEGS